MCYVSVCMNMFCNVSLYQKRNGLLDYMLGVINNTMNEENQQKLL